MFNDLVAINFLQEKFHHTIEKLESEATSPKLLKELKDIAKESYSLQNSISEENKVLRCDKDKYFTCFNDSSIGSLIYDTSYKILEFNNALKQVIQNKNMLLKDGDFSKLIIDDYQDTFKNHINTLLLTCEKQSCYVQLQYKNNKALHIQLNSVLLNPKDKMPIINTTIIDIAKQIKTENTLKNLEVRNKALTDYSNSLIWELNQNNKITYINPTCFKRLSYTTKELIGSQFTDLIHPEEILSFEQEKLALVTNETYVIKQLRILHKNKQWKTLNCTICSSMNVNGEKCVLIIANEFIEIQEELFNEQKIRYDAMIDNLPEMDVYLFDKDLRFVLTGGKEKHKYGLNKEYFVGKTVYDILDEEIRDTLIPIYKKTIRGKGVETEIKRAGKVYKMITHPIRNQHGEVKYGITTIHNITKLKKTEGKLKKAKLEAESSAEAKSAFLANMSHEIRTPLNAIIGFSEQLAKTNLTPQQKKYNGLVNDSSEHLLSIVNEILILFKIGMGKVFIDTIPFDVRKVFEDVYQFFKIRAERKGIELLYSIDDKVARVLIGDPFRLKQVLINLVGNAIKFTDFGSVRFSCSVQKDGDKKTRLKIDVKDTGIGMAQKDLPIIFDEFRQAENMVKEKHGGSGLGLTISKKLVELQKGNIRVKSELNVGTYFIVNIPYQKGRETDLVSTEEHFIVDNELLKDKKILLVDDDRYNRMLAETILRNWNSYYEFAKDGIEALNKVEKTKYDVILMDIHMPRANGVEVTRFIRTEKENLNNQTKIIAVTANIVKGDIKKYSEAGMDSYILKPFKEEDLFSKICNVLKLKVKMNNTTIKQTERINPTNECYQEYDLTDLLSATREDQKLLKKMITTFIKNAENALSEFKSSAENNAWNEVKDTAHRMLASVKYFGMNAIANQFVLIETLVRNKNYNNIPNILNEILPKLEYNIEEMKKEIAE